MKGKNKIPYILLSLIISLMLWFYVVGIEQPEKEETISGIKVTFVGEEQLYEDRALVVSSEKIPTVSITVRGNMINISSLKTRKDEIVCTVDLSVVTEPGEKRVAYDVTLPVENVTITERLPYYVSLQVEAVQTTVVGVVCKNEGSIAEGYIGEEPILTPSTLQISGPEAKIDSIAYAEVVWTRENMDRRKTMDLEYVFRDENGDEIPKDGLSSNFEFITVTVPVKKTKDINLLVEVVEGGGATADNIVYELSPSVISIAGEPDVVDALNSITVGRLELAKIISAGELEFPIILPNEVENTSGESACKVTIQGIVGVSTREMLCESVALINVPEGLKAEIVTRELEVRLRGKEETLNLIYGYNLRAVADLENASISEGRYSVTAQVFVDGYGDVGVVGEYRIIIEVSPGGNE